MIYLEVEVTGERYGRNVRNVTEMIEEVARKLHLPGLVGRHRVFSLWTQIVGHRYAEVSQPDKIQGKTLVVTAADNSWAHDLKMHATLILEKIAEITGDHRLAKVRVVVGPIVTPPPPPEPPRPLHEIEVETADIDAALDASPARDKPVLREKLARVWADSRRLAKRRQEFGR